MRRATENGLTASGKSVKKKAYSAKVMPFLVLEKQDTRKKKRKTHN